MGTRGLLYAWKLKSEGVILPEERLPAGQTIIVSLQHVVAMFGATVLAPILMGFNPNVVVLFSGIGTLIFFVAVGGRVPSYLGSSFSFIAAVIAATAYSGQGTNPNIAIALGGIIAAGMLYTLIGIGVVLAGYSWVEKLMPPVVTGAVIAVIGLNLAPVAVRSISGRLFDTAIATATIMAIGTTAVFAPRFWRRIPILIGGAAAYLIYWVLANGLDFGVPINFRPLGVAAWLGAPKFVTPAFDAKAMTMIAPVAIVLVAENLGHLKALGAMMGRDLDPYLGRAFIGDGIATIVAAFAGGTGMTTYAENIGVMVMTKVYSTLVFVVAAAFAVLLGFSPKFGALIFTIPAPVVGGLSIVVLGLITATAGRIWIENHVDFSKANNLITVGVTLVLCAGDLTLHFSDFSVGGIGIASFGAIILHHLLRRFGSKSADADASATWAMHSEFARATSQSVVEEATASIAHEIKQPLAAITANANAAVRWLAKAPPDLGEAREALVRIADAANGADEVIRSIRAIFKRDMQERLPVDVNQLVLGVLRALGGELQSHQITVQTELIDDSPPVLGDRVQLQQVIFNLITNAVEAMSSAAGRPRVLRIKSTINGSNAILVSIEDSGPGIDPKTVDRIFNAFFTTKPRGMGMGLSICRSIIEAHNGRLIVESTSPHGSVFSVILPVGKG